MQMAPCSAAAPLPLTLILEFRALLYTRSESGSSQRLSEQEWSRRMLTSWDPGPACTCSHGHASAPAPAAPP